MNVPKHPLWKSFGFALKGILELLRNERNFKIEVLAVLINVILVVLLNVEARDTAIILLVCFAVLSAEAFNTAIEKICDKIQPEYDIQIGKIKDISAGAVLLLTFCAAITGVLVYWKYVF